MITYAFNLTLAGLSAKLAQGVVLAYYGARVEKFGLILSGGFLPRFYCDREGSWQLKRRQQLWVFATPLVARLILFVMGVLIWYWTHNTGTDLGTWALLLAHASFMDFLLDSCPLWPVDGFLFMLAYFRLPPNFLVRVYLVWDMVLHNRPLPKSFSLKEKWLLLLYGPAAFLFTSLVLIFVAFYVGQGLSANFSGIFGRGTASIIITAVVLLAIRQPIAVLLKAKNIGTKTVSSSSLPPVQEYPGTTDSTPHNKKNSSWLKKLIIILLLAGICWLLIMPYPYRPGGQIQLLPPTQQQIQAPVDGKIIKVYFNGGDGKWIKSGTAIALMEATDIENDTLKTEQQIKSQQAILEKEQANLNKLLNTPRKEEVELAEKEIDVAKQQVEVSKQEIEVARQEVEVAKKQLDSAKSRFEFSSREADRYKFLAKQGAVSTQAFEDKQKLADADSVKVEESLKNLLVKENEVQSKRSTLTTRETSVQEKETNLKLVLSGAHPDDIAAARKQVEAARAELKRLEQQLKYNKDQLQRTQLLMPIDGYLVTPYLDQKVGSYLDRGDTFAVSEDDRHIRGEVKVPEYNAGEFVVGAEVEVKLAAYPDVSFMGKVVSIEPTAASESSSATTTGEHTSSSTERIIRVIVDLPNVDKTLKAGLTGYAKIQGSDKPVIVAFTRPIVRYIQLEVWSWLP
ncbi:HlyD family secretion protein [Aerosakkonema funiforme]|uniref:HlyD family secretion protein n=2 Tax=Oscillatoriophycideae TaxID=1301283 RepID=UPI0018EFDF93|nr:HlyD family efflux transporter periplasmic adaptor subunit [Aerosakkonema funiforme]